MILPPGSRISVRWTDGRTYSAMVVAFQNGWYCVRFDGSAANQWVPPNVVDLDGSTPEPGMMAAASHGVPVFEEAATVMARRYPGAPLESCMIIEYQPHHRMYQVSFDNGPVGPVLIDPSLIDVTSHHGLYGQAAQEERNNPTVPIGSHVYARRRDGRIMGGTITKNAGDKFLCRWDGERAREYITKDAITQMGGVAPGIGFLDRDPRVPPTREMPSWYRDGQDVWAQDSNDEWWYEARVIQREWITREGVSGGDSLYTIEWADGLGRDKLFGSHLRPRSWL